ERSSYNISWVVYGFVFVLFGPSAAVVVILISHLVEWAWYQYAWYIQAFNIATFALCTSLAGIVYGWIAGDQLPSDMAGLIAVLSALAVFTLLNHLLIGLVLKLARGQSFMESGVFSRLTLIIDFTLMGMGAGGALIWLFNPYATLLAVIPLYLIYHTLKIPALQRQTQTDPKTGLFNARYFSDALASELARADRFDRPLTVVMADLDLLRNINNSYGHLAGDTVLIGVAQIISKSVRDYDVVARFGGEEFAILMPETTPAQAMSRIEAMRATIENSRFQVSTSLTPIQATMSFGIAGRERTGQAPNEIVHSADVAVYQAKLAGRNRICLFEHNGESTIGSMPSVVPVPESVVPSPAASQPAPQMPPPATEAPTPLPPVTMVKSRPVWAIKVYVVSLAVLALGLFGVALTLWPRPALHDWFGIAVFTAIVFFTEWLAIDIYVRDTSVSTSAAPLIAGAILFGPVGAAILSLALAGAAMIRHRSPLSRFIFNASNHLISSSICIGLIKASGVPFQTAHVLVQLSMVLIAASLVYLSSTGLLALAIDLDSGQPLRQVWSERFRWLWPYYLALGIVAYALIEGYLSNGVVGVFVILTPLLMLRFSQTQYLEHTKANVNQLRAANAELSKRAEEVSALNEGLILALSHVVDLRDPFVQGHSVNVARYATFIAEELGLPPARIELIRKAGLLHDIGKLGISEAILFKPGRLTANEHEAIKRHSALGAEIVQGIRSLNVLAAFVRHHHERYDGRGYPDGLHSSTIPLEARILSVADTVEAMASDRPYRRATPLPEILRELQTGAGSQFDPTIVNAFVQVIQAKGEGVVVNSARDVRSHASPNTVAATPASVSFQAIPSFAP
ncbi:MAG: diguanylate cyclase, partial [Chloroflexota bacterium]